MTARVIALTAAVMLAACGETETKRAAPEPVAAAAPTPRPHGVVEDCSSRSEASFPGAFADPANVVVGPLVLVGADYTPPDTIRGFGGNKFPVLLRAGHRATVALDRDDAGLGYGPLPQGVELSPEDGHPVVTFVACRDGRPSGSRVDGSPVTFWSGFVLTRSPMCVPLAVWVDGEAAPRRVTLRMGVRRC